MSFSKTACLTLFAIVGSLLHFVTAFAAQQPVVFWSAEPVQPGEMAMLQGIGWDETTVVAVTGDNVEDSLIVTSDSLYVNQRSLRFVIPEHLSPGVRVCTITARSGALTVTLNLPQPWWQQCDNGQRATPGGWVRIFGRCLAFEGTEPAVQFRQNGKAFQAEVSSASMWAITTRIPKAVQLGEHEIWVHNGTGGDSAWVKAGSVTVADNPPPWKNHFVDVTQFGGIPDDEIDDTTAFTRALAVTATNGGGIVMIPRGRFRLSGSLTLPARVLLKGEGMELTHLVWKDTDSPPPAFFESTVGAFGIEDLSMYAHNYLKGVYVHPVKQPGIPAGPSPADIRLRRVRVRFTPYSLKDLSASQQESRRKNASQMAVFLIYANNVKMIDCDLAWTTSVGFSLQGEDILCRGNVAHAEGGGWCPVGGGRRIICEGNSYSGITTGVTRGGEVWFANNKIVHQYRGDREGFTTDGPFGGVGFLENVKINGKSITFTAKRPRDEPPHIPGAVRVVDGTGAGQVRSLESFGSTTLVMEREFDVPLDDTSKLWAANSLCRHIVYSNHFSDTSIAVQFFGSALDCIVAENTSARSGGFRAWGNEMCNHVQFLSNTITEGYGTAGREARAGLSSIHADGPWVYGFRGTTTRGIVMRRNVIENNATILLHGSIQDALVENNIIKHSSTGIVAEIITQQDGVLLRNNTFEDVDKPFEPTDAGTIYDVLNSPSR
jgi:hypothetical protein